VWTPESELVTAAMKLKRKQIQTKYQILIDQMYQSLEDDKILMDGKKFKTQ
jgi:long-subunit acyl-CoA synthetase (AMP-forming)